MAVSKPDDPPTGADATNRRRRKLSAIMMADVSGFSRMMGANEEHTISLIQAFHQSVQSLVEHFEGRVVDTAGDSVFGEFDSVVNAVRCACRIQEEQSAANAARPAADRIETRIGVHLGDVIVEDYRVYGDGVNIAARLEPMADPGGICLSEAVYQQIRDKLDLRVEEIGLHELKNIQHPIRLYKIPPVTTVLGETRTLSPPASAAPTSAAPAPPPRRVAPRTERRTTSWARELTEPATAIMIVVGGFLLLSPLILFRTAGALPTAGAVVLGVSLGRAWAKVAARAGNFLIALGISIASGALWTDWTRVTNSLFVLGGLIVVAIGLNVLRRPQG